MSIRRHIVVQVLLRNTLGSRRERTNTYVIHPIKLNLLETKGNRMLVFRFPKIRAPVP